MALMDTIQREILEERLEQEMEALSQEMYGKRIAEISDKDLYYVILNLTKGMMSATIPTDGKKKVYYISAEFLIGKLLSNNLINLGVYDKVESILKAKGRNLAEIEEAEPEPSLGNGGLGRLAACFLDSIATLGLPGEGIGLNYHFGLFKQVFIVIKHRGREGIWQDIGLSIRISAQCLRFFREALHVLVISLLACDILKSRQGVVFHIVVHAV